MFPSYTELTTKVPLRVWQVLRVASIVGLLALIAVMFLRPAAGLFVFFQVIVPLLPILFLVAPGLWRNICPLAASNQLPRVLGISRGRTAPNWLRNRGYLIAVTLFVGIAGARLAGLDRSGAAMGIVLGAVLATAIAGGLLFKGKSGWCSSVCPLLPLQRVYGQTPFVTVPNTHCATCVGCAKNCYDFKPRAAYHADLAESDPGWSGPRKLFVAALPGFVLGFFMLTGQADVPTPQKFSLLALFVFVSIGSFYAVEAMSPLSPRDAHGDLRRGALNIFYWFTGPIVAGALKEITGVDAPWLRWPISVTVAALTLLWIARTRVSELQFALTTGARSEPVLLKPPTRRKAAVDESAARVRFDPDGTPVAAEVGMSLLEIAERYDQPLEAGCRMGVCGADPVAVLDGTSCLSPPEPDELNTLRRLGLGTSTRMACCARIGPGTVTVSLTPEPGHPDGATRTRYDRSIVSVVVIGNGIAGVTAADFVRRGHPDCEIHLVGREPHALYNRMGISRLVYGRSAMQGLYLLPDQWYAEHGVTAWLNTVATRIDLRSRHVLLGTGEALPYDRLILAMGASAAIPTDRRAEPTGKLRAARSRRCHADPRVRTAARLSTRGGGGRRPARSGGRLLAAPARPAGDRAGTRRTTAEPLHRLDVFGDGRRRTSPRRESRSCAGPSRRTSSAASGHRSGVEGQPHRRAATCSSPRRVSARTSDWPAAPECRSGTVCSSTTECGLGCRGYSLPATSQSIAARYSGCGRSRPNRRRPPPSTRWAGTSC